MSTPPCILAIDLGTTNCKALLLDEQCRVVDKLSTEYPVSVPRPGWAEQQPKDWWKAVRAAIQHLTRKSGPEAIKAVGLSGQMHGLVALNDAGRVLRPAILWNDQRSFAQCEEIYRRAGGKEGLLAHTNNAMLPGYTGGKILWMRDNEPDLYGQIAQILLPKDYLRYRLTGAYDTDVSDASGTGLFNVRERRWASDLIDALDIPRDWFPDSHESAAVVGHVDDVLASELGLKPGTPVTAGGGDAVMQTVGGGSTGSDTALVVIGTAGNVTVSLPRAIENPGGKLQVFCHVIPEQWVAMGVTLTAGSSLRWYRDTLGGPEVARAREQGRDPYEIIGEEAAKSSPGSHGLIFLPYLQGERAPHVDVNARGTLFGIGLHTGKGDVIRSVMEGVTFSLRDVLELIEMAGFKPSVINASGGGSSSPVWRQIQADVFNRAVTTLDYSEDAGAVGAGIIAGVQVGFWPAVRDAVSLIETRTENLPNAEHAATYDRLFRVYQSLYPALKPAFDELAAQQVGEPPGRS